MMGSMESPSPATLPRFLTEQQHKPFSPCPGSLRLPSDTIARTCNAWITAATRST